MNFMKFYKQIKHLFIRFWRSDNSKVSLLRDVFVAFLFVFIILIALWTYTGQWFAAPMVAIESGSMEHPNPPYGRIGTIDAGDMVLLVKVNNKRDVIPYSTSDYYNYGKKGDVVVYHPDGDVDEDQIIHRAMCWIEVEIENSNTFYTIEEYGIIRQ
ncbi:MAG: S26 family signal peptidase, partial [Thermoplasmata archaeon M8B2D]